MAIDTNRIVKRVLLNGNDIQLIGEGCEVNKLPQVINKTVVELTAEDLRSFTSMPGSFQEWNSVLTSIEIPNTMITVGASAFHRCYGLKTVKFEDNSTCTKLDNSCFAFTAWIDVKLPDSIQTIGNNVFYQDTANNRVRSAILGSSIKSIGTSNFYSGYIKKVILNKQCLTAEDVPTLASSMGASCIVYVPDETTQTLLQNSTIWSASTIKLISELPEE